MVPRVILVNQVHQAVELQVQKVQPVQKVSRVNQVNQELVLRDSKENLVFQVAMVCQVNLV